jgi:Na+-transporting methylmalonyl-CoA/oxaloacetate decarboxylase gamma subunit
MSPALTTALLITAIGMALVFGAILLFWLVMSLLVRFTAEPEAPAPERRAAESAPPETPDLKRRAALAAVAAALAQKTPAASGLHAFPVPPTAGVSAWQAVMRSRQLKQRGPVR